MAYFFNFIFLFVIFLPLTRQINFFRKDYTYVQQFDAFYKIHWDMQGLSWDSAFLACDDEGAKLFYPKIKDEWTLVKNLTNRMAESPNVTEIIIRLHDQFGLGEYITLDGHSTSSPLPMEETEPSSTITGQTCILMNINTGLFREAPCVTEDPNLVLPYVCKKVDGTIDQGYKYFPSLRKCYKVNKRQKVWDEAMRTCYMEGGLLTVIQNKAEASAIYDLLKSYETYHVGVRRIFSRGGYYTVNVIFLPLTRQINFFRKDYTYVQQFDAFYKIHWDMQGLSWDSAFLACDDEGAKLFYPKIKDEWTLVKNLTNRMAESPNVTEIIIRLHDQFGLGEYITLDGHSTSSPLPMEETEPSSTITGQTCILMNINTGLFREAPCVTEDPNLVLPYVCKKVDGTIDQGYKYFPSLRKCYKVNKRQKVWDEAMRTCYMEGGLLTVIQNKAEASAIYDLLKSYETYHVGVRRIFSRGGYYTVNGKKFEDMYQSEVSNNDRSGECGTVYVGNDYLITTSTSCHNSLPFICEMEVNV